MQQSCAADDAAGARPQRQPAPWSSAVMLPDLDAEAAWWVPARAKAAVAFWWTDSLATASGADCSLCSEAAQRLVTPASSARTNSQETRQS